jgi:hypothetical protein
LHGNKQAEMAPWAATDARIRETLVRSRHEAPGWEAEPMTDKQVVEELLSQFPILMIVCFVLSLGLCLMVLPQRGWQKIYLGSLLGTIIPQLTCIFPFYFYIFFIGEKYQNFLANVFWSLVAISTFVSPHWIALVILSVVSFARHFRSPERSYLIDALAALAITAAGAAYAAGMSAALRSGGIG